MSWVSIDLIRSICRQSILDLYMISEIKEGIQLLLELWELHICSSSVNKAMLIVSKFRGKMSPKEAYMTIVAYLWSFSHLDKISRVLVSTGIYNVWLHIVQNSGNFCNSIANVGVPLAISLEEIRVLIQHTCKLSLLCRHCLQREITLSHTLGQVIDLILKGQIIYWCEGVDPFLSTFIFFNQLYNSNQGFALQKCLLNDKKCLTFFMVWDHPY